MVGLRGPPCKEILSMASSGIGIGVSVTVQALVSSLQACERTLIALKIRHTVRGKSRTNTIEPPPAT